MRQAVGEFHLLFHKHILFLQHIIMNLTVQVESYEETHLFVIKYLLSGGPGCVRLSYTAHAVIPAVPEAALFSTLCGTREFRTTPGHFFVATDVGSGHILSGVEVWCRSECV